MLGKGAEQERECHSRSGRLTWDGWPHSHDHGVLSSTSFVNAGLKRRQCCQMEPVWCDGPASSYVGDHKRQVRAPSKVWRQDHGCLL